MSNAIAAALVVATAVVAGYFARAGVGTAQPATSAGGTVVTGSQPGAPGARQPCVTVPVATSGGSSVTAPAPAQACVPGANGSNTATPNVTYAGHGEGGD